MNTQNRMRLVCDSGPLDAALDELAALSEFFHEVVKALVDGPEFVAKVARVDFYGLSAAGADVGRLYVSAD
jgi:cell division protein FtsB